MTLAPLKRTPKFKTVAEEICWLREEVEELRAALRKAEAPLSVGDVRLAALRRAFKLSPQEGLVLAALLDATSVTRRALYARAGGRRGSEDERVIDVILTGLRRRLPRRDMVRCSWGQGMWSISSADKAEIEAIIARAGR